MAQEAQMISSPLAIARAARDAALIVTGAIVVTRTFAHGSVAVAVAAAVAVALWIAVRRITAIAALVASGGTAAIERAAATGCRGVPSAAIPVLAIALTWRIADASLAVLLVGVWTLVAAVDLDRLTMRFPVDSPVSTQRGVLLRHAAILGAILAVSSVLAWVAASVRIGLDLPALILIATLVTVSFNRIVRSFGVRPQSRDE
ncbi:MAG: hypothetical protein EA382_09200 [Spirochaetaceae bacterium]|nr:MAG: hypothetical protein EA382_09200 [Spirochaetaceae bacterium]